VQVQRRLKSPENAARALIRDAWPTTPEETEMRRVMSRIARITAVAMVAAVSGLGVPAHAAPGHTVTFTEHGPQLRKLGLVDDPFSALPQLHELDHVVLIELGLGGVRALRQEYDGQDTERTSLVVALREDGLGAGEGEPPHTGPILAVRQALDPPPRT
jgi:hypothetical protein